MKTKKAPPRIPTKVYLVAGPGGRRWSIWDHGDEMSVCDGPKLTDQIVARVPFEQCRRLDAGARMELVVSAASSIHIAKLLDSDHPNFHRLWR